ncbi:MAG: hypothetical protein K9G70_07645 [Prolixibacteraceae bacterium]|nr:hypothetical protein [Prolixibacteraceae bacterium]
MSRDEIISLAIKSGKIRYDEQICTDFDWKDFDDEKFEYYLKLARISNNMSREEILRNLRILTNHGMTNAGVLYFAKKPYKYIISSKIRCIHFNDDERVDILDKKVHPVRYNTYETMQFNFEKLSNGVNGSWYNWKHRICHYIP